MNEAQLFELLRRTSVDSLWSVLARHGYPDTFVQGLQVLHPDKKMVGRALTVRYLPRREDLVEKLQLHERGLSNSAGVRIARPGDVLVVDACGITNGGALGDILVAGFRAKGGVGIVVYGAVRDLSALREMDLPIYYTAAHAAGSRGIMCVELNVPVNCAGVAVVPGDILVGDAEGVLVIPSHLAAMVAEEAAALDDKEAFIRRKLEAGEASIEEAYPMGPRLLAEYERQRHQRTETKD